MFLQKPLDGFVKAWKQLFFFYFFQVLTVFKSDIWLDILMKIFFGLSFYHKNRVLIFKEVWNVFFSVFKLLLLIRQKAKLIDFLKFLWQSGVIVDEIRLWPEQNNSKRASCQTFYKFENVLNHQTSKPKLRHCNPVL